MQASFFSFSAIALISFPLDMLLRYPLFLFKFIVMLFCFCIFTLSSQSFSNSILSFFCSHFLRPWDLFNLCPTWHLLTLSWTKGSLLSMFTKTKYLNPRYIFFFFFNLLCYCSKASPIVTNDLLPHTASWSPLLLLFLEMFFSSLLETISHLVPHFTLNF